MWVSVSNIGLFVSIQTEEDCTVFSCTYRKLFYQLSPVSSYTSSLILNPLFQSCGFTYDIEVNTKGESYFIRI